VEAGALGRRLSAPGKRFRQGKSEEEEGEVKGDKPENAGQDIAKMAVYCSEVMGRSSRLDCVQAVPDEMGLKTRGNDGCL